MHDPTEAGVIGALWEMAEASHSGFRVFTSRIVVREPTRLICGALNADPLRLIASGALLIACRDASSMVAGLEAHGVPAAEIGVITAPELARVLVHADGQEEPVTRLDRDELYRILEDRA
jgi:hydrogenase maturation factor